ncbi:MAG: ion transporter [Dehalococcoidia bacterium]
MKRQSEELKNVAYELFIAALSVIAVVNILISYLTSDRDIAGVLGVMDWTYSFIFLVDFIMRLSLAKSKFNYFFKQFGWADLLSAGPINWAKLLRLIRVVRTVRMLVNYGRRNVVQELKDYSSATAFLTVLFLIMIILEFGGIAIVKLENRVPGAQISDWQDAMWFIYQTITTTGYGDVVPVTGEGRFVGILVMTAGTALFGTLTGFVANAFLQRRSGKKSGRQAGQTPDDQGVTLTEIKRLIQEQKQSQMELEAKIDELEKLL